MFPHGETVVRLRAGLRVDPYSDEQVRDDWDSPEPSLTVECVAFDPGDLTEPLEPGRRAVDSSPKIYDPSYSDILAGDRIECRGKTYEVDGDPSVYHHPMTGWSPGQVVKLTLREG